jgi:hypothetical protein
MQRQWIQRFVDRKYKKEYLDEKTIRREGYEFKKYITGILNIQNTEKWSDKTEDTRTIKNAIAKWNAEHKNEKDKIKKGEYKAFDTTRLVAQRRKIQKLPGVDLKETLQFHTEQQFANKFFELKGCTWVGDFKTLPGDTIINAKEAEDFVKKGKTSYYTEASETFLIHNDGREFNPRQDVNRNGKLRQDRQNPLVLQTEHYKPGLIEEIDKSAPFTEKVDVEKSMKRVNAKEDRINTIERGAMTKIKDLVKNKNLGAAGQNELRALERLFEDFAKEADKQIYEKEKLITCDPDKVLERKNAFHVTAANYYKQKKNMNELFERLEKAQSDFIKKYAGEPAYQNWKTDLDNKRKESRKKEDSGTADGLTANQKMKMRIENENCNRLANYFTTDEQNIIKRNAANEGIVVLEEQIDRVAHVFILPVHRDFTGAFLTEKDRYNDSFNKRYKTAVLNNDKETQKALSREFTENVLKKLTDPFTADQLEKMNTVEEFEKKYTATKINEAHIKLCAIDNVYKNNTLLPALKTGLEELNRTNKKQYDLIDKKCNAAENAVLKYMIQSFGYNDEKYNDTDKRIQERCKTVVQTLLQQKKREEEEENRR